jgi:hypothetical protein
MDVDRILDRYNLNRAQAQRYLDAISRLNQKETAEEVGVVPRTINQKFKKAFEDMSETERAFLFFNLFAERYSSLIETHTSNRDAMED